MILSNILQVGVSGKPLHNKHKNQIFYISPEENLNSSK